jgi:hypothetical protein
MKKERNSVGLDRGVGAVLHQRLQGWWEINGGRAAPGSPVIPVSRSADKLDVFVVGADGFIYSVAWEPTFHRRLARLVAAQRRPGSPPRARHRRLVHGA